MRYQFSLWPKNWFAAHAARQVTICIACYVDVYERLLKVDSLDSEIKLELKIDQIVIATGIVGMYVCM